MKTVCRHLGVRIPISILALVCLWAGLAGFARPVWAELPPRPEDVPTPTPEPAHAGGGIELSATGATAPYEAVVQWQDGLGDWHDVDGWRGTVEDDHVLWYVAPEHFGLGPFRWIVYRADDTLAMSEPFDLPAADGALVRVSVAVGE